MPKTAKLEEAEARYVGGVRTVTVPKGEEAKAKGGSRRHRRHAVCRMTPTVAGTPIRLHNAK
jgi:hypothetical protein